MLDILLPKKKQVFISQVCKVSIELQNGYQFVQYIFMYKFAGFGNNIFEVGGVNGSANQKYFDIGALLSVGKGIGEVYFFHFAQVLNYLFNQLVDAKVFMHEALYIGEKRVLSVGSKKLALAFGMGSKKAGMFKAVQLEAYGIGGFAEFSFESAQVSFGAGVQEELEQELDTGFGSDQAFEHKRVWG